MTMSILPQRPPFTPQQTWDHLVRIYGSADNLCRRDASGRIFIDADAMDALVESSGAHYLISAWKRFKSGMNSDSMRSPGPEDTLSNWREFMTYHQSLDQEFTASRESHHQRFSELARHPYRDAEEAWAAAKSVEPMEHFQNMSLRGVSDSLTRLVRAMRDRESMPGTREDATEASAGTSVGDCFARAGFWWVVVFLFFVVLLIVTIVVSGGGIAVVAASILNVLIGAGIVATLAGVLNLADCLIYSVGL